MPSDGVSSKMISRRDENELLLGNKRAEQLDSVHGRLFLERHTQEKIKGNVVHIHVRGSQRSGPAVPYCLAAIRALDRVE